MGKKFSEKYGASSVSVPLMEKNKYTGMTISVNSRFLKYILERVKKDPAILDRATDPKVLINFNYQKDLKPVYQELHKLLTSYRTKNNKPAKFSTLYRLLFDEFKKQDTEETDDKKTT